MAPMNEAMLKIGRVLVICTGWYLIIQIGMKKPMVFNDSEAADLYEYLNLKRSVGDWT